MAKLLFHLKHVSEEEADEVRELLSENQIQFYETEAGRWMIGVSAIWLKDESQLDFAQSLIEEYQKQRYEQFAESRHHLNRRGILGNAWLAFWAHPIQFILALIAIGVVLGISILPFVHF